MDKCMASPDDDMAITNDSVTILTMMHAENEIIDRTTDVVRRVLSFSKNFT
jgi:chaperonin GroEL (HSP60 family)